MRVKSLLEQVAELDHIIRQLHKLASRIKEGQNVDGWRECHSIIAMLDKNKKDILASVPSVEGKDA